MNQLQIDITQYLLAHKDGLKEKYSHLSNKCYHLFPNSFLDIYLYNYRTALMEELKHELMCAFNISYEEVCLIFDEDIATISLGDQFFIP